MRTITPLVALWAQTLTVVAAQNIIAPTDAAGVDGNSSMNVFGVFGLTRFQQVYSASLFSGFPDGVYIRELLFRGDRLIVGGAGGVVSIEVYLSTTSLSVDGLSPRFDENLGPDLRLGRGRQPFELLVFGGPQGGGPSSWSALMVGTEFVGSDPFFYNPAAGNLLLDIRIFGNVLTGPVPFDAVNTLGDSVSSLYSVFGLPEGTGQLDTRGCASAFAFEPVPEPGTVALLALGLVIAGIASRKAILRKLKAYGSP